MHVVVNEWEKFQSRGNAIVMAVAVFFSKRASVTDEGAEKS